MPWFLRTALILLGTLLGMATAFAGPSVGFYYGSGPLPSGFQDFDWVIVNPGPERLPDTFNSNQTPFAYISVGETVPGDDAYHDLPSSCGMGTNPNWGGEIINLGDASCRAYLLHNVVDPVWQKGYHAFFLDTVDSYELVSKTPEALAAQRQGLIAFIKALKTAHPAAQLITNRGFSVFPEIRKDIAAVAAESVFNEWDQATQRYQAVQQDTREALLKELDIVKAAGTPVIVIDYLPTKIQRADWWAAAQKIAHLGFTPYVTNSKLTAVGAGLREPMPRHVLMFYSSNQKVEDSSAFSSGVMPLEYLGYIPDLRSLGDPLPPAPHAGEFAGVIVWSDGDPVKNVSAYRQWLEKCRAAGIPVLFVGDFAASGDDALYRSFDMAAPSGTPPVNLQVQHQSPHFGYEMPIRARIRGFVSLQAPADSRVWLSLTGDGTTEDAAAITPWGGYILAPYVLETLPNHDTRWLVDPFALYRKALRLPQMPVPDTTTESGRRLFMAHTDGDGFVSRADFPPYHIAGEVYMHRILERYRLPFTGSVIVGDLLPGDRGLYPAMAPLGVKVARAIFKLPYVEIGSHMWSHPFDWPAMEAGKDYPGINLPVPGYHFSPYMEAVGAAKWMDKHLAPADKKVVIDQWSGDCEPDAQVVGLAYGAGLMNINGGTSYISKKNPSITAVPPIGIHRGPYLQIFAPDANEDYFTNQWLGPFWGYENVIQTFEMTNTPHRLKPIDIYTHWYAATKLASLAALNKVYAWVLQQPITPIYVDNYAHIALNFFTIHVARQADGFWISGADALREMRMPPALGTPNIAASSGVAGYNKSPNGNWYVHLDGQGSAYISLAPGTDDQAYIQSANASIAVFNPLGRGFTAQLKGYVPIQMQLKNVQGCTTTVNGKATVPSAREDISVADQDANLRVHCGKP